MNFMDNIYKQAPHVVVWLGSDISDEVRLGLVLITSWRRLWAEALGTTDLDSDTINIKKKRIQERSKTNQSLNIGA